MSGEGSRRPIVDRESIGAFNFGSGFAQAPVDSKCAASSMKNQLTSIALWSGLLCVGLLSDSKPANAAIFTGTITRLDDPLGLFADAKIGDSVVGFFQFSPVPGDWGIVGTSDEYRNYQTTNPDTNIWDLLVKVITDTTTISNKDTIESLFLYTVQLRDDPTTGATLDSLVIEANHGNIFQPIPLVTDVILNFNDVGGDLFNGDSPPAQINFANADQRVGQFLFLVDTDGDGSRETVSFVEFSIDTLTSATVPEPATLTMFGLGALGFAGAAVRRRKQAV